VYSRFQFSVFSFQFSVFSFQFSVSQNSIARSALNEKERTMPHTQLSQSKSRRDLAGSLRGSRTRKHARLRHRRLQAERLEDRQLLATISGAVFNDLNANGLKDTAESGQSGWTVYLDADGNGQLGTGETSTTTATDGSYSFGGLAAGTYNVSEVQQLGWQQTSPVGSVPIIERVSVVNDGTQGNDRSWTPPSMSADGRYVAFHSDASNLVPGDTNRQKDVFVYDRQADTIERVSLAADGTQGSFDSRDPSISADGRYVAFESAASNLVPDDTNGQWDVFVYDRQTGTTQRVSLAAAGTQGNSSSNAPSISADGRYVAFESAASNLVPGDTNGQRDVFVYDRQTGTIERVSLASDGTQGNDRCYTPAISADGRYVAFTSGPIATNGTDVWIVDAYSDKVYKYTGAASRLTGSQNAASSFSLNSANTSPKDIVTNGLNLWVVNDSTSDKVFKYTTAGVLVSSWTITTAGAKSPTGITLDPKSLSNLWIVDNGTDRVYQYNAAASLANGSSHAADVSFALAPGNTNPQGIADPPAPGSLLATDTTVRSEPVSAEAALRSNDAALASMYYEPLKKVRVDTVRRSESRTVESPTRVLSYTVGSSTNRIADDSRWARANHHQAEVDDLFAQWESDPLQLLTFPGLGI
jgi:archaellum component FlaF (FlaF/FlaG flagellin family)